MFAYIRAARYNDPAAGKPQTAPPLKPDCNTKKTGPPAFEGAMEGKDV